MCLVWYLRRFLDTRYRDLFKTTFFEQYLDRLPSIGWENQQGLFRNPVVMLVTTKVELKTDFMSVWNAKHIYKLDKNMLGFYFWSVGKRTRAWSHFSFFRLFEQLFRRNEGSHVQHSANKNTAPVWETSPVKGLVFFGKQEVQNQQPSLKVSKRARTSITKSMFHHVVCFIINQVTRDNSLQDPQGSSPTLFCQGTRVSWLC